MFAFLVTILGLPARDEGPQKLIVAGIADWPQLSPSLDYTIVVLALQVISTELQFQRRRNEENVQWMV